MAGVPLGPLLVVGPGNEAALYLHSEPAHGSGEAEQRILVPARLKHRAEDREVAAHDERDELAAVGDRPHVPLRPDRRKLAP